MQTISYWEAWSLWGSGRSLDGMRMWGLPMLWWGRIGKLMQFAGGLIAVLDIIGSERILKLADRFKQKGKELERRPSTIAVGIGAFAGIIAMEIIANAFDNIFNSSNVFYMPAVIAFSFLLVYGLYRFTLSIAYLAYLPVSALAWFFRVDRPGHPARWFAFLVVVSGFKFDLLAS